jgi:hypothetical protein
VGWDGLRQVSGSREGRGRDYRIEDAPYVMRRKMLYIFH